ncbi:unnamed protein product [Enterobius vermicularis]|uniref:PRE_C2HC domain-containing protein n=1 Tax=Enterobius vermicularis TaxID=51028 RepID=A0A0N4VDF8_ENTVE|nr:unnamed protein product [Enterobius vermicularis]
MELVDLPVENNKITYQNMENIERILQQLEGFGIDINHIIIRVIIEKKIPLPMLIKAKKKQCGQDR